MTDAEDRTWQRLDKWLWCARFLKARAGCARLVAEGSVRINRQATDKPHARLRPGDVVTLPLRGEVLVLRVRALAVRRGPAPEARALYELLDEVLDGVSGGVPGGVRDTAAADTGAGDAVLASPTLPVGSNDCISPLPPEPRSTG